MTDIGRAASDLADAISLVIANPDNQAARKIMGSMVANLVDEAVQIGHTQGYNARQAELEANLGRIRDAWRSGPMYR